MTSLPSALLEQLLSELSTLASVYHKPPESFVGKGRFGADEIQRAAIQEQRQNAAENPIAASVATGTNGAPAQNNIENLLDIDFDGAAPASAEQNPAGTGTPDRVASPASGGGATSGGGIADMMGLFDAPASGAGLAPQNGGFGGMGGGMNDIMSGFAGMDLSGTSAPPPPGVQLHGTGGAEQKPAGGAQNEDDLLGLF